MSNPRRRLFVFLGVVVLLMAGTLAWNASPLGREAGSQQAVAALRALSTQMGWPFAVVVYTVAAFVGVPVTLLSVVTVVALGAWPGFVCALAGGAAASAASLLLGAWLGAEAVQRLAGPRVLALRERLAARGLLAVVALRLLPVAPFAVANMVAGASGIRLRHMVLGTLIGMTPGTLAMGLLVDPLVRLLPAS